MNVRFVRLGDMARRAEAGLALIWASDVRWVRPDQNRSIHPSTNWGRIVLATLMVGGATLLLPSAMAEHWKRIAGKDGKVSALFPVDIRKNLRTQTARTLAGKSESNFGEFYGDGIMLAGSGSDLPRLAMAASDKKVFESTKKTVLSQAEGKQLVEKGNP